ncbi:hypothetical protein DMENIID0001_105830 [Sergentomyia squamirostris]
MKEMEAAGQLRGHHDHPRDDMTMKSPILLVIVSDFVVDRELLQFCDRNDRVTWRNSAKKMDMCFSSEVNKEKHD